MADASRARASPSKGRAAGWPDVPVGGAACSKHAQPRLLGFGRTRLAQLLWWCMGMPVVILHGYAWAAVTAQLTPTEHRKQ
jgi:hypothetical protein